MLTNLPFIYMNFIYMNVLIFKMINYWKTGQKLINEEIASHKTFCVQLSKTEALAPGLEEL